MEGCWFGPLFLLVLVQSPSATLLTVLVRLLTDMHRGRSGLCLYYCPKGLWSQSESPWEAAIGYVCFATLACIDCRSVCLQEYVESCPPFCLWNR